MHSVAFSPDGRYLASAGGGMHSRTSPVHVFLEQGNGEVKLWDVTTGTELRSYGSQISAATSVAFSPDGRDLACGCTDGGIRVWRVDSAASVYEDSEDRKNSGRSVIVTFSPDGTLLAKLTKFPSHGGCQLELRETVTWKKGLELELPGAPVDSSSGVAFTTDGKRLILASGARVFCWDLSRGASLSVRSSFYFPGVILIAPFYGLGPTMSRDGQLFATSQGRSATVFDAHTWSGVGGTADHQGPVSTLAFSSDGHRLATGSHDNSIKLWDVESGSDSLTFARFSEVLTLRGHEDAVVSVAFSPDGCCLASGSWDGTVKIWDARPLWGPPSLSANGQLRDTSPARRP